MTPEQAVSLVVDYARTHLSPEGLQWMSGKAFWLADESQKATAIPWLTLVATVALLAVVLQIAIVRWTWGVIVATIRK